MKNITRAIVVGASFASAAFAQVGMAATSITCAEYRAMDASGRAQAVESVQMTSGEGGMESGGMASDRMIASDQMAGDGMASDQMAGDGMASDQMASDQMAGEGMAGEGMAGEGMAGDAMASGGMASGGMASGEMMGSDQMSPGDAMMAEDTVAAVLEVCNRDLNVLLVDAVKEATGH